jgi:hypothetical protein
MAFHIDANVLPRIHGYDHARELFNSITPIRGGDQSVRRIGKRNDASKWLKHEIRDGVDVFIAGFHRSNIVEYYPTHYNISMCGWNSLSTQLFMSAITGNYCRGVLESKYVPRGFSTQFNANALYGEYPIDSHKAYQFDYHDAPLQEMPVLIKYKVNRKRMNAVRKIAKPFYTYIDVMSNLSEDEIVYEKDYWASEYRDSSRVIANLTNEDAWWGMFNYISQGTSMRLYEPRTGKVNNVRDVKAMKNWIDSALKANSPQVLDVV